MLSHCANSLCARPFLRLGEGRLFQVETAGSFDSVRDGSARDGSAKDGSNPTPPHLRRPPRRVERYWLCDRCAETWTLVHDRKHGILLAPLPMPPLSARLTPKQQPTQTA